jgi:hypothetical protein
VANNSGLKNVSVQTAEKAFKGVSSMLVDETSITDFIPVLQCIVQGPNMVFGNLHYFNSNIEFLEQKDSKFILRGSSHATQSTVSMSSTQSSGIRLTPSPTKTHSRKSLSSSHNTIGNRSTMSSMSFQRTQSMGRPMSGTLSKRPISSGVTVRRPVTAVDFGETPTKPNLSVRSKAAMETTNEDWFPDHNEASVCLVAGSDDSEEESNVRSKTSEETLRDMVLTANEYFSRSAGDANWWE